jgi:hypothetical protein
MTIPLIKIRALKLGAEFETALTKRKGVILDRAHRSLGIVCSFADGLTQILHGDIKVRPVQWVH